MYDESNRLDRMEALRLWTVGSSWFSGDSGVKGSIEVGQLADLAVLSADYFSIPEEQIKSLESFLTIVGGKIVYAENEYKQFAPPALPISPSWSPVKTFGGYQNPHSQAVGELQSHSHNHRMCGGSDLTLHTGRKRNPASDLFNDFFGAACPCAL